MKHVNFDKLVTRISAVILSLALILGAVISTETFYPELFASADYDGRGEETVGPGGIYNPISLPNPTPVPLDEGGGGSSTPTIKTTCVICGHEFYAAKQRTMIYVSTLDQYIYDYIDEPSTRICTDCRSKYGSTDKLLIENLAAELNQTKSQLQTANASLATQTSLANSYKATVEEQKTIVNQLTSENATLKSDKASLTTQLTNANNEISRLQAALDGKLAEYEQALEDEKTRLQAEIDDLKAQIADKDREIQSLNATIAEKDKKINELTAKITSLEEGIAGMNTDINDLLADIEQKKAAIKSLDERIAAADGDVATLTAERDALSEEVTSKEDLCDELNKQIQENQATIGRLNDDIATLEGEKASLEAEKQAEIDSLNQSVAAYDAELAEKYAAIIDLNTRIAKKDGDIEALNAELTRITNETMELLQRKDEAIHESTDKILELTNKLQANYIAMNTLEGELTTAKGGIKDLQNEIIRLTAEIDRLNQSNATLSQKLADQQLYYERLLKNFADSLQYVVPENSGYTYKDSRTGKTYVCIFGHDCLYDSESGVLRTLADGTEVTTYKALIDTDYDGEYDKHFWFYIGEDGVHYITFAEDGSIDRDELSQTTVKDLQNLVSGQINSLTNELNAAREELKALKNGINTVYEYIKAILEELNIEFDVPDVGPDPDPNPNPDPNPTPDNSDIAKLTEIMDMVRKVADKYKELEGKYNKVSADYASVITAVYGTNEPSGELTPEEVINQLQEEREEAKKKADELTEELTNVKAELASTENEMNQAIATLTDALEEEKKASGEKSDELAKAIEEANGLNEQLQIACNQIKALRASLDAMNSFVKTLATALGLDNVEDTAAILAAVSNLQEQVKTLTKENENLNNKIAELNNNIASLNTAIQQAYAAGYKAGEASGAGKSESEKIKALNAQIDTLTTKISELTAANNALTGKNTELEASIKLLIDDKETLINKNTELSELNKKLTYANTTLKKKVTSLWNDKTNLNSQNGKLINTNKALTDKVSELQTKLNSYSYGQEEEKPEDKTSEEVVEEKLPADLYAGLPLSHILGCITRLSLPIGAQTDDENAKLLNLSGSYVADFESNCEAVEESSVDAKRHANTLFSHYFDNLTDLSSLGYKEAASLQNDKEHALSLTAITSLELIPTDNQKEVIESGQKVKVTLKSNKIEDGTYIVVHESSKRNDQYDIMVVEAVDNELIFELADMSPISIAKLSVVKTGITIPTPNPTPEPKSEPKSNNRMIYLALCAVLAALVVGLYYYKRKNRSPRKVIAK